MSHRQHLFEGRTSLTISHRANMTVATIPLSCTGAATAFKSSLESACDNMSKTVIDPDLHGLMKHEGKLMAFSGTSFHKVKLMLVIPQNAVKRC
jgi:hypothetical protein